jgi:hypothetical protein
MRELPLRLMAIMVQKTGFLMGAGPDLPRKLPHSPGRPGPTLTSGRDGDRWVIIGSIREPVTFKLMTKAAIASPIAGVRE